MVTRGWFSFWSFNKNNLINFFLHHLKQFFFFFFQLYISFFSKKEKKKSLSHSHGSTQLVDSLVWSMMEVRRLRLNLSHYWSIEFSSIHLTIDASLINKPSSNVCDFETFPSHYLVFTNLTQKTKCAKLKVTEKLEFNRKRPWKPKKKI